LAFFVLAGSVSALAHRASGVFSPFVPQPLPQRAPGDFDGDGRADEALIQDDAHDHHVLVSLSGSPSAVALEGSVVSVIAADIDHDGDVDLIAAAPSGELVTWLNDGTGRFILQKALQPGGLRPAASIINPPGRDLVALNPAGPSAAPASPTETAVVVTQIRPPTVPPAFELVFLVGASLRAPPPSVSSI
jgi:hypothetical protein